MLLCQNFLLLMIKVVCVLFTVGFSTLLHKKEYQQYMQKKADRGRKQKDMDILARLPKTKSTKECIEKKKGWNDVQQQSLLHKTSFYVQRTAHSGQIIAEARLSFPQVACNQIIREWRHLASFQESSFASVWRTYPVPASIRHCSHTSRWDTCHYTKHW